ncbi:MAG: hypothetical protein LBV77_04540 [Candidatus Adiutrix intracellularis]|nr:hypothetical protein [Candidatus Adiutrix intracellularis]
MRRERDIPDSVQEPLFVAYNVSPLDEVLKALADPQRLYGGVVHSNRSSEDC